MESKFHSDKTFTSVIDLNLKSSEFDYCTFDTCDLSKVDLGSSIFTECTFNNCDLSNAKLNNTSFKDSTFNNCKLLGLHFDDCNQFLFSTSFQDCNLSFSSFFKINLKTSNFYSCNLEDVDFSGANLSNQKFNTCDLTNTIFNRTNLEKADFRTAKNFRINPDENLIKGTRFSKDNLKGLLEKYDIKIE